jgi:protein TonB
MAVADGMMDELGSPPVQAGSLLSLLPSVALHGAVVLVIWLGLFAEEQIQPPVTVISLVPSAAPSVQPAPPAPVVPAPDLEPAFEPLPLPATGMVLPQPEAPASEPVLDFTPAELPEIESFPFNPDATRPAPPPEDAVPLKKAEEKPQPKAPEKAKAKPEKKEAKAKPKSKTEAKQAAAQSAPQSKPASALAAAATSSAAAAKPSAPALQPAADATQNAAIGEAPVRITNPTLAGTCPAKYPERARKRNQEGTVVLRFMIGTDGTPFGITVIESSGHAILDAAAQEILSGCKFVPQMRGNHAVTAIADQPIPFRLK